MLNKINAIIAYLVFLVIIILVSDIFILHDLLGFGYAHHWEEENIQRYPTPYMEFAGKPNVLDHNEFGFRGDSLAKAAPNDLKIAFWGGSTGYLGSPPIPKILESELAKLLKQRVFVANYSVVSSNHRQHLHGMLEFLPQFKPDLVIFYGGYNEIAGNAWYDPRPGYPHNYFYRAETAPFEKLLLRNSAIVGEIDRKMGILTGLNRLRKQQQPYSQDWNKRIVDKYFETLMLAKNVAETMESAHFGRTKFIALYQPYQVPKVLVEMHRDKPPEALVAAHYEIKERVKTLPYVFDVSSVYDPLGKAAFLDHVHVNQEANELMAKTIADIVADTLSSSQRLK